MPDSQVHDVLVIGGGPSGSSCAYWLAEAGWDVVVCEKKAFPREKTCGDGLTPRAVKQLADMGVEDALIGAHRYEGLHAHGFGRHVEITWPDHPVFPSYGYVITRHDLDGIVAEAASKAGASVRTHTEVTAALVEGGTLPSDDLLPLTLGAQVKDLDTGEISEIRARYVVIADGSNSRIGRSLGTARRRNYPFGMALRGYYDSPRHDESFIESHLDIRDANGEVVPGYGWIFPLGDGRINVGVGLLSTDGRHKGVNTTRLMEAFVASAPESWGIDRSTSCGAPTGGKLPMGHAIGPRSGPNTLLIGDAAGSINPFNGEGIAYGYETGRMAAIAVGEALAGAGPKAVLSFPTQLDEAYATYFRVARVFLKIISEPAIMRACVGQGLRSDLLMSELLRIMANLMRPEGNGPGEIAYRAGEFLTRIASGARPALDLLP